MTASKEDIERAFDFRGDVTIHLRNGERVEGYVFNRDFHSTPPRIEMYPKNSDQQQTIACEEIGRIEFTGKDPAAGRSWDAWLQQVEKAQAEGKIAELYPEELD